MKAALLAIITWMTFNVCYSQTNKRKTSDVEREYYSIGLQKIASKISRQCPRTIDEDTEMFNVIYTPSDTCLNYNYKLIRASKSKLNIPEVKRKMYRVIQSMAKDNPAFQNFKKLGVHVSATYYDKDNYFVCTFKTL